MTQTINLEGQAPSVFNNPEFGSVRVIMRDDGEPLFCLKDVATCLGYADQAQAVRERCDADSVVEITTETSKGPREAKFGPESEVYRLIFGSKLESAKKFQDWVFKIVLPSIRKTGSYSVAQQPYQIPQTFAEALQLAADIQKENEKLLSVNKAQSAKIAEDKPKVDCWNQFMASGDNVHIRTFVKMIQDKFPMVTEDGLFDNLRDAGVLQSHGEFRNQPYAKYGPKGLGYFALKRHAFGATPLLTPKGQEWCYQKIKDYYSSSPDDMEDLFLR